MFCKKSLRTLLSDVGDAQLILGAGNQTLLQKSQKQRLFDFVFKFRIPVFMDGFILHGCRFWTFKDDLRFHPDRLIIRLCRAHSRYEWIVIPPWSHWIFGLSEKNCMKQKPPAAVFGKIPVFPIISIQHGREFFNKIWEETLFSEEDSLFFSISLLTKLNSYVTIYQTDISV